MFFFLNLKLSIIFRNIHVKTNNDIINNGVLFMIQTISISFLSACLVGFYGVNCLQNCSMTCGIPGNCDRITGYCNGGCQRGWAGDRCEGKG